MVLDFGILSSSLFPSSDAAGDGIAAPIVNQIIWKDVGIGIVPIGSVVAWCKNLATAPPLLPNYVECNGQVLSDGDSPFNGATIPNLNGNINVLKGNAASSGLTSEDYLPNHTHRATFYTSTTGSSCTTGCDTGGASAGTSTAFYNVVWIMRVK